MKIINCLPLLIPYLAKMLTGSQNFDHRSVVVVKNPDSTTLNEKHFIADITAPKHEQLIV